MSYRGTEAARLDTYERAYEYEVTGRQSFDVVEGGGIDARVRRGVTSDFVAQTRLVAIAVVLFVVLGAARVAITTATVTYLKANLVVQDRIEQAQETNASLRIERSVLSNTARITRIASQNYGMTYCATQERVDLTPRSEEDIASVQTADVKPDVDGNLPATGDTLQPASHESFPVLVQAHVKAASSYLTEW